MLDNQRALIGRRDEPRDYLIGQAFSIPAARATRVPATCLSAARKEAASLYRTHSVTGVCLRTE